MNVQNSIAGLFVGFLIGLTGMGGAALMAPILIFLFHYKAKFAIGSDLAYAAIAKFFGALQHKHSGKVNLPLVGWMALGSLPSSLVGVYLLSSFAKHGGKNADEVITRILGVVLLLVGLIMVLRSIPSVERRIQRRLDAGPRKLIPAHAIIVGVLGGFLVGLTSIGGGTVFGVAMLLVFGLSAKEMVGTDIAHACLLSSVAALGHIYAGDVDYGLVGGLLIGAIPGILLGGLVSTRMPEHVLRPTLATVLLITAFKTFI